MNPFLVFIIFTTGFVCGIAFLFLLAMISAADEAIERAEISNVPDKVEPLPDDEHQEAFI